MSLLAGCDLDRTLVYSAAALHLDVPDADAPPLVVAEVYQGAPLSFTTRTAQRLLEALVQRVTFVPVTTRTQEQFRRIQLPSAAESWAVTTNGAVILHDGVPDSAWIGRLRAELDTESAALPDVERLFTTLLPSAAVLRTRIAESVFVYAIVDRAALPDADLAAFTRAVEALGWTVSLQGRKLYAVPVPIRKERALAEVAERTGVDRTVAAGDSLLDREMLLWADLGIRPRHGELEAAAWTAPTVVVTDARGVRAGEEVLRRITAEADRT